MSLKYNVPLGVFMLFIFSAAGAQQGMNLFDHMLIKLSEKTLYGDPAQEKVVGTPYLSEDFVIGDVYDNKGKYAGVPMRYNIYEDQIEFKQNGQLYILDPQPKIKKVDLDHRTFVVSQYEYRGKTRPGYFFLLDSGKVILMSKKVVTYREQQPPKALESGPTPAKFSKSQDVFFY